MSRKHFKRLFTSPSDFAPASTKEFLDIQATVECGFTLKRVRDMTRTYSHDTIMFGFIKKMIVLVMPFFSCNALKCASMKNQDFKTRQQIVNINSNETLFYLYSIEISKCSSSCNKINDPYANLCVLYVIKDVNVKVFNLMSRTNETKLLKWHEPCKSKCRLDASVSNEATLE